MTLPKVLLVGAAGAYALHRARKSTARRARGHERVPRPDPADPVQELYSETDPAVDLDTPAETTLDAIEVAVDGDTGELYGVRVPAAQDREHRDDDEAMADGQNWIESLHTDAAEGGPEPERELDIIDENDLTTHATDTRDRPIADLGAAGRAGN